MSNAQNDVIIEELYEEWKELSDNWNGKSLSVESKMNDIAGELLELGVDVDKGGVMTKEDTIEGVIRDNSGVETDISGLAEAIKQYYLGKLKGMENKTEHEEDGECGCSYLEEEYPCQIHREAHNSVLADVRKVIDQ